MDIISAARIARVKIMERGSTHLGKTAKKVHVYKKTDSDGNVIINSYAGNGKRIKSITKKNIENKYSCNGRTHTQTGHITTVKNAMTGETITIKNIVERYQKTGDKPVIKNIFSRWTIKPDGEQLGLHTEKSAGKTKVSKTKVYGDKNAFYTKSETTDNKRGVKELLIEAFNIKRPNGTHSNVKIFKETGVNPDNGKKHTLHEIIYAIRNPGKFAQNGQERFVREA